MAKDHPIIPPPVLTPPGLAAVPAYDAQQAQRVPIQAPPLSPSAARAIANSAELAHDYALAAAHLCKQADTQPPARTNARRLLRLALAHLEP